MFKLPTILTAKKSPNFTLPKSYFRHLTNNYNRDFNNSNFETHLDLITYFDNSTIDAPSRGKIAKRCYSETAPETNGVNVTVLGADTKVGSVLSFILKQNPIVNCLALQGSTDVNGLAAGLSHFDTRSIVRGFSGPDNFCAALKTAEIVVFLGQSELPTNITFAERIMVEGARAAKFADFCIAHAPKAILVVNVHPVSIIMPIVSGIFKKSHWYHPSRIIGATGSLSMRANTLASRWNDFDPSCVHVPLLGGPDLDCAVPLFSAMTPVGMDPKSALKLTAKFRMVDLDEFPKKVIPKDIFLKSYHCEACALNRLVTGISLGLRGDEMSVGECFVRSNQIPTCKFLLTPVKFSKGGIVHNFGIPKLTKFEQCLVSRATTILEAREKIAEQYVDYHFSKRKEFLPRFKQEEIEEHNKFLRACL